ncbi:MAG: response regulator [Nitrospina sp.]|jgi:two-component system chemotaxis response regulator CheY|nr:response regulator [Nitrospina sp.]MBT3507959.1 response regulator [Nitrospina sp.]MBT3876486.1 response regulator [Nitrospina sp.]MBT4048694.1 response regulator [Nitrospina sp.]MBT4558071.1 response regulator [Nitrospina sp.]
MEKTLKILIVEDSDVMNKLALENLEVLGFKNATGVSNGVEAMAYLEENPVDLIISDWEMPKLNGLGLLKAIRKTPSLQEIPFILMSIHDDFNQTSVAKNEGVTEYLCKPVTVETLSEAIEKIFS